MKKRLFATAVASVVMLSTSTQTQDTAAPKGCRLQRVLIMNYRNLRAPLANDGSMPEQSAIKA